MAISLETVLAALMATAGSLLMTRLARVFVWDADMAARLAQGRYGNGDYNTIIERGDWAESFVRGYTLPKLAALLCRGRGGCRLAVPTLAYVASLLARNLALLALAQALLGGQAMAALFVFLSLNALIFSYGNTDYWALGVVRGTAVSEHLMVAAYGFLLLGAPLWGFVAVLVSVFCSPVPTLFIFGPGLAPAVVYCVALHGLSPASVAALALLLLVASGVLVLFLVRLKKQGKVDPEAKALVRKIQFKYLHFRETLFHFHRHFSQAPVYLALALGTVALGLWSLPDARLAWVLAATLGLGLLQWFLASVLVERGVAIMQFGEFMRSVYWVGALLPLFWACVPARALSADLGWNVLLATVFLAGSFQLGKGQAFNGPVLNCGINVHDKGLMNAAFAALPLLAWAGTRIPIDPALVSWGLAGLMGLLFLTSGSMLLKPSLRWAILGLAVLWGLLGWWSREWAGPVLPFCLLVAVRALLEPLCRPKRSFRNINRETRELPFASFVRAQSPETLFLVPFNFLVWHHFFPHRALLTNWILLTLNLFDGHTRDRLDLLRDVGVLDHLTGEDNVRVGRAFDSAWRQLDENRLKLLVEKYGVDFLLREKNLPLDLPVAFDSPEGAMRIYDLSELKRRRSSGEGLPATDARGRPGDGTCMGQA